jgi:hypothetical protein
MSFGGGGRQSSMARYVSLGDLVSVFLSSSFYVDLVDISGFMQVSGVGLRSSVWYGFIWLVFCYIRQPVVFPVCVE